MSEPTTLEQHRNAARAAYRAAYAAATTEQKQ